MLQPSSASELEVKLLSNAQAYLRSRLARQVPDSVLVASWQEFHAVYGELIRRFVIARGVRGADIDDCVQETWYHVAQRLTEFRHSQDRPGLRAWLYTLVRSVIADLRRHRAKSWTMSLGDEMECKEWVDRSCDPQALCERYSQKAMIRTVLAKLRARVSETNYRLLHMRFVDSLSVPEVAAALNLTRRQVWYRQHRLLKKLRAVVAVSTAEPFATER